MLAQRSGLRPARRTSNGKGAQRGQIYFGDYAGKGVRITSALTKKQHGYVYLPNRYSYEATGVLKLGILGYGSDLQNVVADGKHQRIEDRLNDFIVKLEAEAVCRKRHAEHLERQHRYWEEQERIRREREERQRKEIERLKGLEQEAADWRRAEQIRAYVAVAEAKQIQQRGAVDAGSEIGRWLAWARHKADWIDPLIRAHCEVLDEA